MPVRRGLLRCQAAALALAWVAGCATPAEPREGAEERSNDAAAMHDTGRDAATRDAAAQGVNAADAAHDAATPADAEVDTPDLPDAANALDDASQDAGVAPHDADVAPRDAGIVMDASAADSGSAGPTPCRAGSVLSVVDAGALYAEYGSVFSSTAYVRDVASSHNPRALVVQVRAQDAAVADCEVRWSAAPGHGWLFPSATKTDANGRLRALWTAGALPSQSATAQIRVSAGDEQNVSFTGSAVPSPRTRTDSVHIDYDISARYTELKVRVTPLTGPASTYYSTMNWPGAYAGIQFDGATSKVLFSVWDLDASAKAELLDAGVCNQTVGFGGEGTGTSCRLLFPPSRHGAIVGLPDDYRLEPGHTYETHLTISYPAACPSCADYTVSFRDLTRGLGPISLGTQRYKQRATPQSASGFIEDWLDVPGDHCLNALARSAYFHDIQFKTEAGWQPLRSARFSPNYHPDNHEICANNFFGVRDGKFLMSAGGDQLVSRPVIPNDPDFGPSPRESL